MKNKSESRFADVIFSGEVGVHICCIYLMMGNLSIFGSFRQSLMESRKKILRLLVFIQALRLVFMLRLATDVVQFKILMQVKVAETLVIGIPFLSLII